VTTTITTVEQLNALPTGAIVRDCAGWPWLKSSIDGHWDDRTTRASATELIADYNPLVLLYPIPEPDHSMCAQLKPFGSSEWLLYTPDGAHIGCYLTAKDARSCGFPVPVPTVEEQVVQLLDEWLGEDYEPAVFAASLRNAGLLKDNDQ